MPPHDLFWTVDVVSRLRTILEELERRAVENPRNAPIRDALVRVGGAIAKLAPLTRAVRESMRR